MTTTTPRGTHRRAAAVVVGVQLLHYPIVHSATFAGVCRVLTGLVYYR
jgi:hypothetical protein